MEDPARHVSVAGIFELYGASLFKARRLLDALLSPPLPQPGPAIRTALAAAMMSPDDALNGPQREWLSVLRR